MLTKKSAAIEIRTPNSSHFPIWLLITDRKE